MAARTDTSAFCSPSGWLNLQGTKFKYLKDKVHIIKSLKLIHEIDKYTNNRSAKKSRFLIKIQHNNHVFKNY